MGLMKKVLLINRKTEIVDKVNQLKTELERSGELQVSTVSFADINLLIDGENSFARINRIGMDLADFDKVVCITTASFDRLYVFSAFGCYCRKKGVKMLDDVFSNTRGKLYEMWRLWENDIPVPKTAYGSGIFLGECLVRNFNNIGVLKAVNGTKGRDNHFVNSPIKIARIVAANPSTDYILQEYIPSDGDYRIVTLDYQPYYAAHFSNRKNYWRSTTSNKSTKSVIPLDLLKPELLETAVKASRALNRSFAGVDIITNNETGQHYVLEVNHTPQIVTGNFTADKITRLRDYLLAD